LPGSGNHSGTIEPVRLTVHDIAPNPVAVPKEVPYEDAKQAAVEAVSALVPPKAG
jgi:hypothetical protein